MVFLISQVGDSFDATRFLGALDNDPKIREMVYCSTSKLEEILRSFQSRKNDVGYTARVGMCCAQVGMEVTDCRYDPLVPCETVLVVLSSIWETSLPIYLIPVIGAAAGCCR